MVNRENWIKDKLLDLYNKTKNLLFDNKDKLIKLSNILINKKILLQEDFKNIL